MAYKSNYNYFFLRDDTTWGVFNTLTGSLVVLKESEKLEFDDMPDFNIEENTLFKNQLIELGILQHDYCDEKSIVNSSRFRRTYMEKSAYFRILTTTACNAKCSYCYEKGVTTKTMTKETAKQVIQFILEKPALENLYIHWFGGEPLMNTSVIDMIMDGIYDEVTARGTTIFVYFTSNGSLLTKELAQKARSRWHANWFQITIDGLEGEYDQIKNYVNKNHNFDVVIKNIKLLLREKILVNLRVNYLPYEVQKVKRVITFLKDEFVDYYSANLIKISPAPIFGVIKDDHQENIKKSNCCNIFEPNVFMDEIGAIANQDPFDLSFKGGQCFACHQGSFIIDPTGNLFKCTLTINDLETCVGSVFEGIKENREYFRWVNPILPKECDICVFLPICQGGCRAGYFGYIDYCCNRFIPELDKILEYKITQGEKHSNKRIDDILLESTNNDIYLN